MIEAILIAIIVYMVWRNYQLEKRWRALRYAWQTMTDFSCEITKVDGEPDDQWKAAVEDQAAFLRCFDVKPMTRHDVADYEGALVQRKIDTLPIRY